MSLAPPNSTSPERALFGAVEEAFDAIEVPIARLWDADSCPAELLAYLAWALSVDEWDPDWPEETRRDVIRASANVHRHKGTLGAIRDAVAAAGYGDSTIVEGMDVDFHDGEITRDGTRNYGTAVHWATYRIYLTRPLTIDQADSLRRILDFVAPARCHLAELNFTEAAYRHNAAINRDGTASYGVA